MVSIVYATIFVLYPPIDPMELSCPSADRGGDFSNIFELVTSISVVFSIVFCKTFLDCSLLCSVGASLSIYSWSFIALVGEEVSPGYA